MLTSTTYPQYHGSPYDRGAADSWYRRPRNPHYWPDGTNIGQRVEAEDMTADEIEAYNAGYDWNESLGGHKDWGD